MAEKKSKDTVTIKLPLKRGEDAMYLAHNGKGMLIKRGIEVEVPLYIAHQIEDIERAQAEAYERLNTD